MSETAALADADRRPVLGLVVLAMTLVFMVLPPAVAALVLLGVVA